MIRKLKDSHKDSLMKFIKRNVEMNIFIIGDIEVFGFDKDFLEVWAEFDTLGNYIAVLLRYKTHFVFYSPYENFNAKIFCSIIESYDKKNDIYGDEIVINKLSKFLNYRKHREQYFAKLIAGEQLVKTEYKIESAMPEDATLIYLLREKISEFRDFKASVDNIRDTLQNGLGRTYIIRQADRIVASASTTAENSMSAMIVTVMTDPDYRNKGYASACVSKLCNDLLKEGKTLCLFYDNPKAGSVYKKLGFEDIGKWITLFF